MSVLVDFIHVVKVLERHVKSIVDGEFGGAILFEFSHNRMEVASITKVYSPMWIYEEQNIDVKCLAEDKLTFGLDKDAAMKCMQFLQVLKKTTKTQTISIEVSSDNVTITHDNAMCKFVNSSTVFPSDEKWKQVSVAVDIKKAEFDVIRSLQGTLPFVDYVSEFNGVFVEMGGRLFLTDSKSFIVSKNDFAFPMDFFIPFDVTSKIKTTPEVVNIFTGNKAVGIDFGSIKYIVNSPADENVITNNIAFPIQTIHEKFDPVILEREQNTKLLAELDPKSCDIIISCSNVNESVSVQLSKNGTSKVTVGDTGNNIGNFIGSFEIPGDFKSYVDKTIILNSSVLRIINKMASLIPDTTIEIREVKETDLFVLYSECGKANCTVVTVEITERKDV